MAGFSVANNEHLIRSQVWDTQIKRVLEDELMGNRYVRMIPYWGGGALNIPSIGQYQSRDYIEGQQVLYDAVDTGNFQFTPNEYKSSATYITNKMKQDSFYMSELTSTFVPGQAHAISIAMEAKILATGPNGQTASNVNAINTANHRWIGSGPNETLAPIDFAKAKFALQKANAPMTNLVAIVDSSTEYALSTMTNLVNLSNNPVWGGIVKTGISTGMRFITNIYGFDIYTSNYLKLNTGSETILGLTSTVGVNNLFFSASPAVLPFVGSIPQAPKVDSYYNHDFQREEYVTTCRFDYKLFRQENMVVVVTDTDQVV